MYATPRRARREREHEPTLRVRRRRRAWPGKLERIWFGYSTVAPEAGRPSAFVTVPDTEPPATSAARPPASRPDRGLGGERLPGGQEALPVVASAATISPALPRGTVNEPSVPAAHGGRARAVGSDLRAGPPPPRRRAAPRRRPPRGRSGGAGAPGRRFAGPRRPLHGQVGDGERRGSRRDEPERALPRGRPSSRPAFVDVVASVTNVVAAMNRASRPHRGARAVAHSQAGSRRPVEHEVTQLPWRGRAPRRSRSPPRRRAPSGGRRGGATTKDRPRPRSRPPSADRRARPSRARANA